MEASFGTMIRATRLGWGLSKRHGAFIRMSDADGKINVELCPLNNVPVAKAPGGNHRVWWKSDGKILECLPWLAKVTAVKKYIKVTVGEDGEIVK